MSCYHDIMEILPEEIWKTIQRYGMKTKYEISSHGRLRKTIPHWETGTPTTSVIKTFKKLHKLQYKNINGEKLMIHRLVAMAFIPIQNPNKMEINHKDHNIHNNSADNLEWVPRSIR